MSSGTEVFGVEIFGAVIDDQTRCTHYATPLDVIAIKFFCCGRYYPCHQCHQDAAEHSAQQWPVERQGELAVLCGACGHQLSIAEYDLCQACPQCDAAFNPGCALHWELYFQR